MKIHNALLAILGVFGFSFGGGVAASYPAQAAVAQQCTGLSEEECCQEALNKNTIEALEEFLRKYPPGRSKYACSALARLTEFSSPEPRDFHTHQDTGGGGYGG